MRIGGAMQQAAAAAVAKQNKSAPKAKDVSVLEKRVADLEKKLDTANKRIDVLEKKTDEMKALRTRADKLEKKK